MSKKNALRSPIDIFLTAFCGAELGSLIRKRVTRSGSTLQVFDHAIDLENFDEVVLIGFGKASIPMGAVFEELLGEFFSRSLLISNRFHRLKVKSDLIIAGHPLPDANSFLAGRKIVELLADLHSNTLIFFLISGGGSALVELPILPSITLEDYAILNQLLITCGATIQEINSIRKHISGLKGGKLGALIPTDNALALYVSDVNSGDLHSIASNPLLTENLASNDPIQIIDQYELFDKLPDSIQQLFRDLRANPSLHTSRAKSSSIDHEVLIDNSSFLNLVKASAERAGYHTQIYQSDLENEYGEFADRMIEELLYLQTRLPNEQICLIAGGELKCKAEGKGLGGRNQEFVLYCAKKLMSRQFDTAVTIISCGTDGIDGNTSANGAVVQGDDLRFIEDEAIYLRFLQENDSHGFNKLYGGGLYTGPTGHNIRDVYLLLTNPVLDLASVEKLKI